MADIWPTKNLFAQKKVIILLFGFKSNLRRIALNMKHFSASKNLILNQSFAPKKFFFVQKVIFGQNFAQFSPKEKFLKQN